LDLDETISRMLPPLRVKTGVVVANRANLLYEQVPHPTDQIM